MKYALLGAAVVAYSLVTLAASRFSPALSELLLVASYAMAAAVALVNAAGYARQDRLHRAWLLFGVGYIFGFTANVSFGFRPDAAALATRHALWWNLIIVVFNVLLVGAEGTFARMWNDTGLRPPGRLWLTLGFLGLALLLDGQAAINDAVAVGHGDLRALTDLISVVTDITSIGLVGPILSTAVALRGGLLVRPWLFLFSSSLFWLFDDATVLLPARYGATLDLFTRVLAVQAALGAALAQQLVRRELAVALRALPAEPA